MTRREQLEQAIAHLETQRATLGDAVVDVSIAALREKLAAPEAPPAPQASPPCAGGIRKGAEQQRKQVTVLLADVSGSTAMAGTMDPEDLTELMNALWERLDTLIVQHGGTIDKHMGDAVLALWGAETAREDDPERAVRAALAIQAELAAFREDPGVDRSAEPPAPLALACRASAHAGPPEGGSDSRRSLAMRIGINTGPVLLGEVGTTGEYTAIGDTVNTASRLEGAAPVGRILISHDTYRHVRGLFDVQALEPIQVKGKAEPIQVYLVRQAKPRAFRRGTRGVDGVETRMIGREAELTLLQDALHAALDGRGQMITITGEAGLGKSRLLYEFENWVELLPQPIRYFKGRAGLEMQNLPYALIRDLLSFRFGIQESDRARVVREKLEAGIGEALGTDEPGQMQAHVIGQLLGFDFSDSPHLQGIRDDAQQLRDRGLIYLSEFFQATTQLAPVVILLEDIHWADDSSLDLIHYLARTTPERRLLMLCLARPILFERRPAWNARGAPSPPQAGGIEGGYTHLELRPLSERDSQRLVEEILQKVEQVPMVLRDLVVRGAEGNPFYVEELTKMLIEDGVIVKEEEHWRVEPARLTAVRVPPTLTGVLQARLDSLPPEERTVLQQASVVGRKFWDRAVVRISESASQRVSESASQRIGAVAREPAGAEQTSNALSALQGKEMVFRRGTSAFAATQEYIFKHAILREVTYESVLKRVRRVYHGLVAEWLIQQGGERAGEYTGLIADHLELAGETERAAIYLRRAGERAAAQFANTAAVNYLSRALDLTPETDHATRYALLLARERVYDVQGNREAQTEDLAALERLAEALNDDRKEARVALRRAHYGHVTGDYPAAIAASQTAIDLAQTAHDVSSEAEGHLQWGQALLRQGEYEMAWTRLEQARALVQAAATLASPLPEGSVESLRQIEADSLRGLGGIPHFQSDYAAARAYWEQALLAYREIGDRRGASATLNNLGVVCWSQGDYAGARAYYEQALLIFREIGYREGEGNVLSNLGLVSTDQGDYAGARTYLEQALLICREIGDRQVEGWVLINLGRVSTSLADYVNAVPYLEQALRVCREIGNRRGEGLSIVNLGVVLHQRGDSAEVRAYLEQALLICREVSDRQAEGWVLSYLGALSADHGDYAEAQALHEQAQRIYREIGDRKSEGWGLASLGLLSHHLGDHEAAREYSQQALLIAQDAGDRPVQSFAFTNLGHALADLGHLAEAAAAYRDALDIRRELDQPHLALEPLAGLARVSLAQGNLSQAQARVEEILSHLDTRGLDGVEEPFWVYLACYHVLRANQDPRREEILDAAYRLLQERAAKLDDEELRHSFLEDVVAHREILAAWEGRERS